MPEIESDIGKLLEGKAGIADLAGKYVAGDIGKALASAPNASPEALIKTLYTVADFYIDNNKFDEGSGFIGAFLDGGVAVPDVVGEAWLLGSEFHGYANRYNEALRHLENARILFRETGDTEKLLRVQTDTAYFLIRLGDYGRARDEANSGLVLAGSDEYAKWRMRLLSNLGLALKEIGDNRAAIDAFRRGVDLAKQLDNPRVRAVNLVNIGNLYGHIGRDEQAVEFMLRAKAAWEEIGDSREVARSLNNLGNLLLEPDPSKALEYLRTCIGIAQESGFTEIESAARHNIGLIYKAEGRFDDAKAEFKKARELSSGIGDDDGLWRADQQLARLALREGNIAEARGFLEKAVAALTHTRDGLGFDTDRVRFLADRESLFADLVSADLAEGDTVGALADIQKVKGVALYELMTGGKSQTINEEAIEEIPSLIGKRKIAILDFFLVPDRLVVGMFTGSGIEVREIGFDLKKLESALGELRDKIKAYEISPELRSNPQRKDAKLDELLETVSQAVLGDVARLPDGVEQLAIIPHGVLGQIPFASMRFEKRYIVERMQISVFPNLHAVKVFLTGGAESLKNSTLALIRGDADDLAALDSEAESVKRGFPGEVVDVPVEGLESLADAGGDWIHYAGHASFRRDALEPYIEIGDRRVRFSVPGGKVPDVAILAACQTGLGEMPGSGEMFGIARSMFAAGGKALVLSLWQVDDKGTGELMADFYSGLGSAGSLDEALASAQRKAIEKGRHPYFWAGFVCNGNLVFS